MVSPYPSSTRCFTVGLVDLLTANRLPLADVERMQEHRDECEDCDEMAFEAEARREGVHVHLRPAEVLYVADAASDDQELISGDCPICRARLLLAKL